MSEWNCSFDTKSKKFENYNGWTAAKQHKSEKSWKSTIGLFVFVIGNGSNLVSWKNKWLSVWNIKASTAKT